jgi:hypothetical protein
VVRCVIAKIKGRRRVFMQKTLEEVLKEGGEYETVGFLVGRFGDAWIVRAFSPEGKVYYYYTWMENDENFIEVLDKTKKGRDGYPTPSRVEGFILGAVAEGYLLHLSFRNAWKYELDEIIGGRTLKDWYEDFLRFFERVQGKSIVWHTYDEVHQAIYSIEIPKDEWPDYWVLTIWEREELMRKFGEFISELWHLIWSLIEKVALKIGEQQGKILFSLQDIVEFIEKRKSVKTIQTLLGSMMVRLDKKQKEWMSSIVWQKLLEAVKQDKELTFYDIDVYLGVEEE